MPTEDPAAPAPLDLASNEEGPETASSTSTPAESTNGAAAADPALVEDVDSGAAQASAAESNAGPAPVDTATDASPEKISQTAQAKVDGLLREAKFADAAQVLADAIGEIESLEVIRPLLIRLVEIREDALSDSEGASRALKRWSEHYGRPLDLEEARVELLARTKRHPQALEVLAELTESTEDPETQARLWERMGDIANSDDDGDPQHALVHYQTSFRIERTRVTAIRKAALLLLDDARYEQAKQLIDLERETTVKGEAVESIALDVREEFGRLYARVAEGLLTRPVAHPIARQALASALTVAPGLDVAESGLAALDAFPTTWKDHVRKLRDEALDARDKREAAKRYLAIAEIYRAYAPDGAELEQNVNRCLLVAPGYRPALKFLESVYREDGRLPEFVERLKKQVKSVRTVEVAVDMWLFIAVLMAESGAGPDEMAEAYNEVRRVDPRNMAAISALTELHMEAGRYPEAAEVMEEFLSEASDVGAKRSVLRTLARLYEVELEDLPKAKQRLEALRALDDDDDLLLQLADIYERLGDLVMLANTLEALREREGAARYQEKGRERLLERLLELYRGPLEAAAQAFDVARDLFVVSPRDSLENTLMDLA